MYAPQRFEKRGVPRHVDGTNGNIPQLFLSDIQLLEVVVGSIVLGELMKKTGTAQTTLASR